MEAQNFTVQYSLQMQRSDENILKSELSEVPCAGGAGAVSCTAARVHIPSACPVSAGQPGLVFVRQQGLYVL